MLKNLTLSFLSALLVLSAFMSEANAAKKVGVTAAVNPNANAVSRKGKVRRLYLGNKVYFKERINTAGSGLVQILFVDGSTITVGANASLVIDKFVYDPQKGKGKLAVSFGKGVMRFIGGKISKQKDSVSVRTSVGTAGIRGGMANIAINGNTGVFSFLFGRELLFKGLNGQRRRIYQQGYTLLAERAGRSKTYSRLVIRRTRRGETELFANHLAGKAGKKGGARKRPTHAQVRKGLSGSRIFGVVLPRVKPKVPPFGVVATPRFDLDRKWLDVNPNFDRGVVCITPTQSVTSGGGSPGAGTTGGGSTTGTEPGVTTNQPDPPTDPVVVIDPVVPDPPPVVVVLPPGC